MVFDTHLVAATYLSVTLADMRAWASECTECGKSFIFCGTAPTLRRHDDGGGWG
jgi:hypothetical protein